MSRHTRKRELLILGIGLLFPAMAFAVTIDTVPVGNPGNTADYRYDAGGWGKVDYHYDIGSFEVTAGQYAEFLNAVAASDPYALYDDRMWTHDRGCKIERAGTSGNYTYSVAPDWANRPVNYVNWGDSARFANWMHNGQPAGPSGPGTTEDGSYFMDGATSNPQLITVQRQDDATWVLPTLDEWYKAAYYDAANEVYYDFATQTNTVPSNDLIDPDPGNNVTYQPAGGEYTVGAPYWRTEVGAHENSFSFYRTYDQSGNVYEFNETVYNGIYRGLRGGSYNGDVDNIHASFDLNYYPTLDGHGFGFRLARVPEPASLVLLAVVAAGVLRRR